MSAIYAKDLASNLHDTHASGGTRHSWNAGGLRHVIKALQGRPVAIELDNMTGNTQVGVKLLDVRDRFAGGEGIAVENEHGVTVFGVRKVGVIISMGEDFSSVKYDAIESERREHEIVRQLFRTEIGEQPAGTWETSSGMYDATASYRPSSYTGTARFQYRKYSLQQVQAASLCDTCLRNRESQTHEHHCPQYAVWLWLEEQKAKAQQH